MPARILYVDDEPDIQEVAAIALELDPDFEVLCCGSGAEALELARSWQPDLILLDVMMPGMDGPTTFAALQEMPEAGSPRSCSSPPATSRARSSGCSRSAPRG